ncbi:MAG: hypothetical protein HQL56_15620 [Magnetococcales bacterium]|nr:hypothetical protein [Magnetococcales bacterium]
MNNTRQISPSRSVGSDAEQEEKIKGTSTRKPNSRKVTNFQLLKLETRLLKKGAATSRLACTNALKAGNSVLVAEGKSLVKILPSGEKEIVKDLPYDSFVRVTKKYYVIRSDTNNRLHIPRGRKNSPP